MTRWLDFNDTYLAKEPAHPSDNFGLLFALSGVREFTGKDLITAAVLAYDIQCRFCEAASVRARGWDHVNYILVSAALAGAKLLGFDKEQMYNAVALAITSHAAVRQPRQGSYLSEQKNMAAGDAVRGAAWALEKVLSGADGPAEIIDGKHGFVNQISGPLDEAAFKDLGEHFMLADTYIKQFPMEYHGQTIVEHALAIRDELGAPPLNQVEELVIRGYEAQRTIIGDESKRRPATKETADHSLYYAFAAPFLEGKLTLDQYRPEMLRNPNVLGLIGRTKFIEVPEWTERYYAPNVEREFVSFAEVRLKDGRKAFDERRVPHGHPKNPVTDREIEGKFESLAEPMLKDTRRLIDAIWNLDSAPRVSSLPPLISFRLEGS
jgi:2-methylcitrate dehydratase